MKQLSYREKIVLLFFIVLLVIIVFVAVPIKNIKKNIKNHTADEAKIEEVYDKNKQLISEIPSIEDSIMKIYDDSKGYVDEFTIHRQNFEIDKYVQDILNTPDYKNGDKNKMEIVGGFTEEDASAQSLEFYYYTPNVITYPILEAADINGDLLEVTDPKFNQKVTDALIMNDIKPESVEQHIASVDVRFTKDALMAFEDKLKELDKGVRITSVTINDYDFGALSEIPEDIGYSKGTIAFSFYTMQQIQKPVFK